MRIKRFSSDSGESHFSRGGSGRREEMEALLRLLLKNIFVSSELSAFFFRTTNGKTIKVIPKGRTFSVNFRTAAAEEKMGD